MFVRRGVPILREDLDSGVRARVGLPITAGVAGTEFRPEVRRPAACAGPRRGN
ncbi:hypothetical protein [Mycobacterium helveticum]|jgi:hypothetical protein|uniref:hypothetical protein n=1 Tax=Mycobacterium helveticum TaxID=2592811 RepID=UPI00143DDCD5|nr:hypothetical protein [Mycobacterium helveticum]